MDMTIGRNMSTTPGLSRAWRVDAVSVKRTVALAGAPGSCGVVFSDLFQIHTRTAEGALSKVEVRRP